MILKIPDDGGGQGDHGSIPRQLLTVKQTAYVLCCSEANVYALIESGRLPFVLVGIRKGYRIDLADIQEFINRHKEREAATPFRVPRPRLKHLRPPRPQ